MGACMSGEGVHKLHGFILDSREHCIQMHGSTTCFMQYVTKQRSSSDNCRECYVISCKYDMWAYNHKDVVFDRYIADCYSTIMHKEIL